MKQRLLILAAATSVLFAACNGGGTEGSYTQEQLDSITKMKTDSAANALKLQNDSLINAQAAAEARTADSLRVIDSVFNAGNKSGKSTVKKPVKPAPPKSGGVKPAPKPEEVTAPAKTKQDDKFDSRAGGTKTISEEKKKEQDDKFKRRGGN